ncbi:MAG TPA: hypothetical protein VN761_01545 [Candidatus Polarisedimenticolia bacterium]|nr:hypothetical protein [Candidatus Polarisedimenticolia bacterium]
MSESAESAEPAAVAWQPLTPKGVLAFARAPLRRLLILQFILALVAAITMVWFLRSAWFPTIRAAIQQLPENGEMKSGKLDWSGDSPALLAEGHFLAFVVDTNHTGKLRSPAQVQVEFGRDDIYFYSLAGYREWRYPPDWNFGFNRVALQPWWGAWEQPIQWLTFAGTAFWCLASWTILAMAYFFPVWLGAFFANRHLTLGQSWKLAGTALMPGALLMILAILAYGFGVLDLVQFSAAVGAHIVAGWVYLVLGVWAAPKISREAAKAENPFASKAVVMSSPSPQPSPPGEGEL